MRPFPPKEMYDPLNNGEGLCFLPAKDIWEWVSSSILEESGDIYNKDHEHLLGQNCIEFLWAGESYRNKGKSILGQAEQVQFMAGGWKKGRQEQQMREWFGRIPKFLITLSADFCNQCTDLEFCALIEHELYHIAHAIDYQAGSDEEGNPVLRWSRDTGLPVLEIRRHDVEEFVGVVRRYGMSEDVKRLVDVANQSKEISSLNIAKSCGTCNLKHA